MSKPQKVCNTLCQHCGAAYEVSLRLNDGYCDDCRAQLNAENIVYRFDEPGSGEDDEDEDDFDCGFIPGDGCQLAGTEDCDFECPYRDRLIASPYYPNCDLFGTQANDETNPDCYC